MGNTKYTQMMDNGKWLTAFLAEDITAWQIKDLAREAIALLGVDYEIKDNDPTFIVLEKIENEQPESPLLESINQAMPAEINKADSLRNELEEHEQEFEKLVKKIIRQGSKENKGIEFVMEQFGTILKPLLKQEYCRDPGKEDKDFIYTDVLYRNVYDLVYYRTVVLKNLKIFAERPNVPWEYLVHHRVIEQTTCNYFPKIIESYGRLAEKIITIKPTETGKKSPVKSDSHSLAATHRVKKIFTFTNPEAEATLPWGTVIARIFFDFLFSGGRDYYGFCQRCDRFFVIQRKGRKKYCGDSCRAMAAKERADS